MRVPKNQLVLMYSIIGLSPCAVAQKSTAVEMSAEAAILERSSEARLLVIEAEDLGMAHSIDKASFEAMEKGWVTSAGILVPAPWFPEVVRWARSHPNVDFGIQLDLNAEWPGAPSSPRRGWDLDNLMGRIRDEL